MSRSARSRLAKTTLDVIEQGCYVNPRGETVEIKAGIEVCNAGSEHFDPDELDQIRANVADEPRLFNHTTISLVNETTLEGAKELSAETNINKIGVLNFASAKNPGGGFLGGSQAQEESLARSSSLYGSLNHFMQEFYEPHRRKRSALYSDRMIYTPACPVFRDDTGLFLEEHYKVDFLTSAAPNAGAIQKNEPDKFDAIPQLFKMRIDKMLALFVAKNCDALVLGAWGCGVFRNCPNMVAESFAEFLNEGAPYFGRFKHIRFSVLDRTKEKPIFNAFDQFFAEVL